MKLFKLAAVVAAMAVPAAANAAVTVNITQSGANVLAAASGSLNTGGLTNAGAFGYSFVGIGGTIGYFGGGVPNGNVTGFSGLTGPTSFGSGGLIAASSSTGVPFAFNASTFASPLVFVAPSYASGSAFVSNAIFLNQTLASLGLTAGTYVYSSRADTVTFNIGNVTAAVPEPATWALMIVGFAFIGGALRRRSGTTRTTVRFA